jgi:Ricin-type beta-trefoil lectin domain-like
MIRTIASALAAASLAGSFFIPSGKSSEHVIYHAIYHIRLAKSTFCLAATDYKAEFNPVVVEQCNGSNDQEWYIRRSGSYTAVFPVYDTLLNLTVNPSNNQAGLQSWTERPTGLAAVEDAQYTYLRLGKRWLAVTDDIVSYHDDYPVSWQPADRKGFQFAWVFPVLREDS